MMSRWLVGMAALASLCGAAQKPGGGLPGLPHFKPTARRVEHTLIGSKFALSTRTGSFIVALQWARLYCFSNLCITGWSNAR